MYFTAQVLAEIGAEFASIEGKYNALYLRFLTRQYASERGKEVGHQGMLRRLQSMWRCIRNVYELIPPEREEPPDDDTRHDTELQVQAFVFHTFGAADNLAWIWVSERNIRKLDGAALREGEIGIRNTMCGSPSRRSSAPTWRDTSNGSNTSKGFATRLRTGYRSTFRPIWSRRRMRLHTKNSKIGCPPPAEDWTSRNATD
jgi:hypothetical protein